MRECLTDVQKTGIQRNISNVLCSNYNECVQIASKCPKKKKVTKNFYKAIRINAKTLLKSCLNCVVIMFMIQADQIHQQISENIVALTMMKMLSKTFHNTMAEV